MILRLPSYYREFACIAHRCKDSCCIGWEIDIDEETFEYYQSIQGDFGDRLRANMTAGAENSFRLKNGRRCPFLNDRNLCDIVLTLGETSLCEICTEYPRFTLEYADVREKCLGISCEEVGRIIFTSKEPISLEETEVNESDWIPYSEEEDEAGEAGYALDYEEDEAIRGRTLEMARDHAIAILQNRKYAIEVRICQFLLFAEGVQKRINEGHWNEMVEWINAESKERTDFALPESVLHRPMEGFFFRKQVLDGMELLDEEWHSAIQHVAEQMECHTGEQIRQHMHAFMERYREREYEYEHLMVYFVFRYGMKAVFDDQFLGKAQLAVLSFLTIRDMDMVRYFDQGEEFTLADRIDNVRIYSKEVEHSEDNLEYLAEEFIFTEEMHPIELCRQVLFV